MKTLELTSDVVFKAFMMSEKTRKYKARMLNAITEIPIKDLEKAIYTSNELPVENKNNKVYRTDIIITVKKNIIVLEMNKEYYDGLFNKNHMYSSRILSTELEKGEDYIDLKEIIEININAFETMDHDRLINKLVITNKSTGKEAIEYSWVGYQIDLISIIDKCYTEDEKEKVKWFNLFVSEDIESLRSDNIMNDAIDELERISNDSGIVGLYDKEAVDRKVFNSKMKTAERIGTEKGMKKGMEKGMEKGLKQGIEQGIKQGIKQDKMDTAKKLIKEGIDFEIIEKVTGITKEDLEKMK